MAFFIAIVCVFFVFCFCSALLKWNEVRYRKKGLPPGTMGWPVFGETPKFLKQGPNFMKNQKARYGSFFKTHILGGPAIISSDPELNRYILLHESKGLVSGYPKSMLDILGKRNMAAVHGSTHKYIRGALLSMTNPTSIRDLILPKIDEFMRSYIRNWENKVIDIQEKTKEMAFLTSLKQVVGTDFNSVAEAFKSEYFKLVLGTISLPINLPGTNYHTGIKARKNINRIVSELMEKRRTFHETHQDMLGWLLAKDENKHQLCDEEILDLVMTIMYSGFETVSTTSMMTVKFLHDNPKALEELRNEHLAIRERKKPNDPIDINDLKAMRFTRAVIFETSRLAAVVNGVLRKTTHDLELNGYFIPKGWRIYVYTRDINYDPFIYPDPFTFNPWRWIQDKNLESHNYNLLFGKGIRVCPGKELGITEVSTFLHYLVTRYRWEEVGGDKLMKFPRVMAPKGLHLRVSSYEGL